MIHPLKAFDIEFVKLKNGDHEFEFELTEDFFKHFESSLTPNNLNVKLLFTKNTNTFSLFFEIQGEINTSCDRCLDDISIPVNNESTIMVKITEKEMEDQDDIIYLSPFDYKINVAQPIYDFVLLSIPIKITCEDNIEQKDCNVNFTNKITKVIDVDLHQDSELDEELTEDEEENIN